MRGYLGPGGPGYRFWTGPNSYVTIRIELVWRAPRGPFCHVKVFPHCEHPGMTR